MRPLYAVNIALAAMFAAALVTYGPVRSGPSISDTSLVGRSAVVDGDTIRLAGARIRFDGIDAPESDQICRDGRGFAYACGASATQALAGKIGTWPVACDRRDVDRYGRVVAVCRVGTEDLNEWMVRNGWAVAYLAYSWDYALAEAEARFARRGIWAGDFTHPADWRRTHPRR